MNKLHKKLYWFVFTIILLIFIFIQYFGLIYYKYAVPPGHDAMMHWWIAKPIFERSIDFLQIWNQGGYPPGFHYLISELSHLFSVDPMDTMLWLSPSILILSGLAIFYMSRKVFGNTVAIAAFLAYAFLSKTPLQQLNDGGYPNLIASQILLPLLILFGVNLFTAQKSKFEYAKWILSILAALLLIGVTHHISFFYVIGLILLMVPVFLIYRLNTKKITSRKFVLLASITLALSALFFGLYNSAPIFAPFRHLSAIVIQPMSAFPFFKIVGTQDPESLLRLFSYPSYLGISLSLLAFLGIIFSLVNWKRISERYRTGLLILIVYSLMLFIGSRLSFLTNPDRLVRDLAFPLSVFAGIFLVWAYSHISNIKPLKYKVVPLLCLITITAIPIVQRIKNSITYEPMVRITSADMEAIEYIRNNAPSDSVLIEGFSFYFDRFLPDSKIHYLWLPQTMQYPGVHPLDPSIKTEMENLRDFDYIYIVDRQTGWAPKAISFGFAENYTNNKNFEKVGHFTSQTNEVYLFKVLRP